MSILLHPKSRGNVTLHSADPLHNPIVNPNFLEHPDDLDIMLKARRVKRMTCSQGLAIGIGQLISSPYSISAATKNVVEPINVAWVYHVITFKINFCFVKERK